MNVNEKIIYILKHRKEYELKDLLGMDKNNFEKLFKQVESEEWHEQNDNIIYTNLTLL